VLRPVLCLSLSSNALRTCPALPPGLLLRLSKRSERSIALSYPRTALEEMPSRGWGL
jgi:hypothetical protein